VPTDNGEIAILDACVLYPLTLCDTLLRAAEAELYRPRWSSDILDEVVRTLVKRGRRREDAERRVRAMRTIFDEANVSGFAALLPQMTNDPKDRHVLAAAVHAGARIIVTSNVRHFPRRALAPYRIEARRPDDFLGALLTLDPGRMDQIIKEQAAALRNPPVTVAEILDHLANTAPRFAATMRQRLGQR
jgi:predicted nucleic acid-binding protein